MSHRVISATECLPGRDSGARIAWWSTTAAALLLLISGLGNLSAQTIRGTVVDATSHEPLDEAVVVILKENGKDTVAQFRSNASGQFLFYARETGTYVVRANRVGFAPLTGEPVSLKDGEVTMVQLSLSAVPTTVGSIEVTSRRALTAQELMSSVGFDIRRAKGRGAFIDRAELAKYGQAPLENVIRDNEQKLSVAFGTDANQFYDILLMRAGINYCVPEVRLDGNILANTRGAVVTRLRTYGANQIYGIESYRASQLPPPTLGAELGINTPQCGAVAIWTRSAASQTGLLLFKDR